MDEKLIVDTVRQTLFSYYDAIKKNGLMAEFKYLDDSPDFFWVPPGYTSAISYDSVATILKQNASAYKSIVNVWDTLRIQPLTPEFASYTGRLHSIMIDTTGKTIKVSMVETGIMIKRNDGWKLLSGQTSVISE